MRLKLLLIALGGGAGSALRYLVTGWVQKLSTGPFPVGTLTVNVVGCFAIGILNYMFLGPYLIREEYRLAIVTGILGGFTTFSSYGWETLSFTNDGAWLAAGANVMLNNGLGFFAAWSAYRLAETAFGA